MQVLIIRIILISVFQIISYLKPECQTGFKKQLEFDSDTKFLINDLQYKFDNLYLYGTIHIDSMGLQGGFVAVCDTTGEISRSILYFDPERLSHFSNIGSSQISVVSEDLIYIPIHFFNSNEIGLCMVDLKDNSFKIIKYNYSGFQIFPKSVFTIQNDIYILGFVQRLNYFLDNFILKTDLNGNFKWIKYYGTPNYNEYVENATLWKDSMITLSSCIATEEFATNQLVDWKKPWIFTIDTSGMIIKSWKGEEFDEKTLANGPIYHFADDRIVQVSKEYQEIFHHGVSFAGTNPTITSLNSDFSQNWKQYLGNFGSPIDEIMDLAYDSKREEILLSGQKVILYEDKSSASEVWFIKVSEYGEILWSVSDTITLIEDSQLEHASTSIDVLPSGSIYSSVNVSKSSYHKGYIVKITSDGCLDTLCLTTSDNEQIREVPKNPTLYPNPAHSYLRVDYQEMNDLTTLVISDLNGRLVQRFNRLQIQSTFHLNLPPGAYIYTLLNKQGIVQSGKLIVI